MKIDVKSVEKLAKIDWLNNDTKLFRTATAAQIINILLLCNTRIRATIRTKCYSVNELRLLLIRTNK